MCNSACDSLWVFDFRDTSFARRFAQLLHNYDPLAYGYYGDYADLNGIGWVFPPNSGIPESGTPQQFWADWGAGYQHFWDILNDDRAWCAGWKQDNCTDYQTCPVRPLEGIGPYRQDFFS
jgi:hypothetical protein